MSARRWIGVGILALLVAVMLIPHGDPNTVDLGHRYGAPSWAHPLGTDNLGRDLFARMAVGFWRTALVVVVAGGISLVLGVLLGLLAGYVGGFLAAVVLAVTDIVIIVPTFIAALIVSAILGLTPLTAGIALGVFGIGPFVNQTHSLVRSARESEFMEVERLMGTRLGAVLGRHILPTVRRPILAYFGSTCAGVTVAYAGLAFIGLGVDTSTPDWGTMLYDYRANLTSNPLLVLWPTLGILLLAVSLHLLIDRGQEDRQR